MWSFSLLTGMVSRKQRRVGGGGKSTCTHIPAWLFIALIAKTGMGARTLDNMDTMAGGDKLAKSTLLRNARWIWSARIELHWHNIQPPCDQMKSSGQNMCSTKISRMLSADCLYTQQVQCIGYAYLFIQPFQSFLFIVFICFVVICTCQHTVILYETRRFYKLLYILILKAEIFYKITLMVRVVENLAGLYYVIARPTNHIEINNRKFF